MPPVKHRSKARRPLDIDPEELALYLSDSSDSESVISIDSESSISLTHASNVSLSPSEIAEFLTSDVAGPHAATPLPSPLPSPLPTPFSSPSPSPPQGPRLPTVTLPEERNAQPQTTARLPFPILFTGTQIHQPLKIRSPSSHETRPAVFRTALRPSNQDLPAPGQSQLTRPAAQAPTNPQGQASSSTPPIFQPRAVTLPRPAASVQPRPITPVRSAMQPCPVTPARSAMQPRPVTPARSTMQPRPVTMARSAMQPLPVTPGHSTAQPHPATRASAPRPSDPPPYASSPPSTPSPNPILTSDSRVLQDLEQLTLSEDLDNVLKTINAPAVTWVEVKRCLLGGPGYRRKNWYFRLRSCGLSEEHLEPLLVIMDIEHSDLESRDFFA